MKFCKDYIILYIFFCIAAGALAQSSPAVIIPKTINDPVTLDFQSLKLDLEVEDALHLLKVYVGENLESSAEKLPVQGTYSIKDNTIVFKPYFPFMERQIYSIKVHLLVQENLKKNSGLKELNYLDTTFNIPNSNKVPLASVLNIFPSSTIIPENTLRFYIYFSTPMKREVSLKYIKLLDENGKEDLHAFMKFKRELWSPDGKRLTLLFDPGRIKRNVVTNLDLGPALKAGKRYRLVISPEWEDVYNQLLNRSFIKTFTASQAYRKQINTSDWKFSSPKINSKDALTIQFDRSFDHALLQQHMIVINNAKGDPINGTVVVNNMESEWVFTPWLPWKNENYFIVVNAVLEDISGNNLHDLLDHTVEQGSKDIKTVRLPISLQ